MGATGDEHVVVMLNGRYSTFRKSDGQQLSTSTLNQFWTDAGVATTRSYDPRIVYDAASQRWFAIAAEASNSANAAFLVGVSKTSDPTDGFTAFRDRRRLDEPDLGRLPDARDRRRRRLHLVACVPGERPRPPAAATTTWYSRRPTCWPPSRPSRMRRSSSACRWPAPASSRQPVVNLDGGGLPAKFYAGTLTFLGQIQLSQITGTIGAPSYSSGGLIGIDRAARAARRRTARDEAEPRRRRQPLRLEPGAPERRHLGGAVGRDRRPLRRTAGSRSIPSPTSCSTGT